MNDKLTEVAATDSRYQEEAHGVVFESWDMDCIIEESAQTLRAQLLNGHITVDELRLGVIWANALDKEAVELYGSDFTTGEERVERAARRIMHLAGRGALMDFRNKRVRTTTVAHAHVGKCGMGVLETHDIRDRNLVQ